MSFHVHEYKLYVTIYLYMPLLHIPASVLQALEAYGRYLHEDEVFCRSVRLMSAV